MQLSRKDFAMLCLFILLFACIAAPRVFLGKSEFFSERVGFYYTFFTASAILWALAYWPEDWQTRHWFHWPWAFMILFLCFVAACFRLYELELIKSNPKTICNLREDWTESTFDKRKMTSPICMLTTRERAVVHLYRAAVRKYEVEKNKDYGRKGEGIFNLGWCLDDFRNSVASCILIALSLLLLGTGSIGFYSNGVW